MLLVAACGSSSGGIPTLTPTPPRGTPTALPPAAAATTDLGLAPTATPRTGGAQDAPNRLFVDLVHGSDANDGLRNTPLRSLDAALNKAASLTAAEVFLTGGHISGTYNLNSTVRLYGGFDSATWERKSDQVTSITSTSYALSITAEGVRVDGFTLQSTGPTGLNSIAVLVTNATGVQLTNDVIIAASGVAGAAGANGQVGDTGAPGKAGANTGDCPPDRKGGAGGSGASGSGGTGGDGGFKGGTDGASGSNGGGAGGRHGAAQQDGRNGSDGDDGVSVGLEPGQGGDSFGVLDASGYTPAAGKAGAGDVSDGKPGGGGGGGGGKNTACGGGGGGGGAGGIGSHDPGQGGQGGGASIGVLAINSDVTISASTITTGNGGAGGRGGDGGPGGSGGAGGAGGERNVTLGAGGAGGSGGKGGSSAAGGGGGGGPTVGVLGNSSSNIGLSGTTVNLGNPGTGGAGGAPAGSNGEPGVSGGVGIAEDIFQAPEPQPEDSAP
jgi:hypothetical protein